MTAGDGGPFSRVKGAARKLADMAEGTATIGGAWQRALRDRAISPTRYLAPLVKRATGLGDPPVNSTPKRVVYARGGMKLIRFEPAVRRFRTPILFVYSLINRYYILDFLPGRSLIEFMTQQGFDVYAIDWGTPGPIEQDMTWDDLLGGFVEAAKRWIFKLSGCDDLTMYGYCMGGTLAGPTTAYIYDWNLLPIGQALWLKELETYREFPPMQDPASYNLEQVMAQLKKPRAAPGQ